MMDWNWQQVSGFVAVLTVLSGVIIAAVRYQLRDAFVGKTDMEAFIERLEALEARLTSIPNHSDILSLSVRVGALETGVASMGAEVRGVRDGVVRVEHLVDLLVRHQLRDAGA